MKIIDRYIFKNLLISFALTLTIFTFVLFTGTLFKIAQMFIGKINVIFIGKFFLYSIPYLLAYAIPMSFLTANLLVFGQLSAENEITALKASGINIFRIILAPVIMSLLLTGSCIFINDVLLPHCHYELRKLKYQISTESPEALLEAGVLIDYFDDYLIYVDEIDGKNMSKVSIQQNSANEPTRFIKAESGTFSVSQEKKAIILKLNDVIVEQQAKGQPSDNNNEGVPNFIHAQMGMVPIELKLDGEDSLSGKKKYTKRLKDYSIRELRTMISQKKAEMPEYTPYQHKEAVKEISKMLTEINTRLSLAFSCLGLLFIGVSLGIRTHRSEKTVGIPISLTLFAIHYGFTLFGKALEKKPAFYPEIIVWIPDICLGILGLYLIYKIAYK
ncbi:MAG: YjgP/YjgQ family permease [Candidatus Auribacter fodinae]|jgi:lipopolysaccharide export system permease protein|uniref:YjgP/YjgQ family permease n=1 Tax=Candidatus Auribacter fodinae TaxID=2093366 RepID=A0A3A4QSR5_9BACT|nr:MAG: YjgP/YjgQ family permease [Candidatus Auribacter fodinae]